MIRMVLKNICNFIKVLTTLWIERGAGSRFTIITPQQQTRRGFMAQKGFHNWHTTMERGLYCSVHWIATSMLAIWIMSQKVDSIDRFVAVSQSFNIHSFNMYTSSWYRGSLPNATFGSGKNWHEPIMWFL